MLKITAALRAHMEKEFGLASGASDDQVREMVINKQLDGALDLAKIRELTVEKAAGAVAELDARVSKLELTLSSGLAEIKGLIAGGAQAGSQAGATGAAGQQPAGTKAGAVSDAVGKAMVGSGDAGRVEVLKAVDRYSDSTTAATWDRSENHFMSKSFGGRNVAEFQHGIGAGPINMPSARSLAITGAFMKHLVNKQYRAEGREVPWQFKMTEHDRELVKYAVHECRFSGPIGYKGAASKGLADRVEDTDAADIWVDGVCLRDLPNGDYWQKAVLDDSTSGGLEAVPIEFDQNVILTPLLNGELFPLVDTMTVSRRRQEGVKVGNPTMSWGTGEGTSVALFDTDGFITAFDNSIYPITGALELGRDFLADSPVAIGQIVQRNYGERFKAELDNAIANGNGTNRPEGLFIASGLSTVTPAGGAGAAPQVGDYEGLQFGVAKQYLSEAGLPPNSRAVFLGTQTSYMRARGIPVDSSSDARRIFGSDNQMDYRLMGFKYAINESAGNAKIGFFCLNRYRLYRRAGLEVRVVRDDRTSVLSNTELVVVRARFGGALTHAAAGVKITNAQS